MSAKKSAWRDDNLKALCGFANTQGGRLVFGRNDDRTATGLSDAWKLLEELPQKIPQHLGITPAIKLFPLTDTTSSKSASRHLPRFFQSEVDGSSTNT